MQNSYLKDMIQERMISVEWMNIEEFLSACPYENVKNIVDEALVYLLHGILMEKELNKFELIENI